MTSSVAAEASERAVMRVLAILPRALSTAAFSPIVHKTIAAALDKANRKIISSRQLGFNMDLVRNIVTFLPYNPSYARVSRVWRKAVDPLRREAMEIAPFARAVRRTEWNYNLLAAEFDLCTEELVKVRNRARSRFHNDDQDPVALRRELASISVALTVAESAQIIAAMNLQTVLRSKEIAKQQKRIAETPDAAPPESPKKAYTQTT